MVEVLINNYSPIRIEKKWIYPFVRRLCSHLRTTRGEVGITFVDNRYIRRLNKTYRGINRATDVLSFPQDSSFAAGRLLGDVVISLQKAKAQAKVYGHSLKQEIRLLIVHGLLHLLGYKHKEMEKIQKGSEGKSLSIPLLQRGKKGD